MKRRVFLQSLVSATMTARIFAAVEQARLNDAADLLEQATVNKQVHAASLYVQQGDQVCSKAFGAATTPDDIFLLASISKPISIAALMTLYDQGKFKLDEPVQKYIPEFRDGGRDQILIQHLLTHVCGLPDQLPNNQSLRQGHAPLSDFIAEAIRTPLLFGPATNYSYSSMGILVAAELAQRLSGVGFLEFVDSAVCKPLGMTHSALGLGRFAIEDTMLCQVEDAAPESGGGDAAAKRWDWNSSYWRRFGAPWGGAHGSAPDVARFLADFLRPSGKMLNLATSQLMLRNHNPPGLTPRGLGFAIGTRAGSPGCSEETFGHTGATGTLAWADPSTNTICVVLTTLPSSAADPHPRRLASELVAKGAGGR